MKTYNRKYLKELTVMMKPLKYYGKFQFYKIFNSFSPGVLRCKEGGKMNLGGKNRQKYC